MRKSRHIPEHAPATLAARIARSPVKVGGACAAVLFTLLALDNAHSALEDARRLAPVLATREFAREGDLPSCADATRSAPLEERASIEEQFRRAIAFPETRSGRGAAQQARFDD